MYESDVAHFARWCSAKGHHPATASPQVVAEYLVDLAERSVPGEDPPVARGVSTLNRKLSAMSHFYKTVGLDDPTKHPVVRLAWQGIRRLLGTPSKQKQPADPKLLEQYLSGLGSGLTELRDAAILAVGFAAGMRRSEIVAIHVSDLTFEPEGMTILIERSKTDQAGHGRNVSVPSVPSAFSCPVKTTQTWLAASGIVTGPVFRPVYRDVRVGDEALTPQTVGRAVKGFAVAMGLDPRRFAGHSLRSGFVTAAHEGGADAASIMDVTGHKSFEMLRRYIRSADRWKNNAGARIQRR